MCQLLAAACVSISSLSHTVCACLHVFPLLHAQLIEELKVPKGPQLGKLTAAVMDWQMAHPNGSKEACLEAMKQQVAQQQA